MRTVPQPGEVWFIDLGMVGKPRYALVLAAQTDARLAPGSVVLIRVCGARSFGRASQDETCAGNGARPGP